MNHPNRWRLWALILGAAVFLALIRTLIEPLIAPVTPAQLAALLVAAVMAAGSCLAMMILTFFSRHGINVILAPLTIAALVVIKLFYLA
jgi:hypothetical protein